MLNIVKSKPPGSLVAYAKTPGAYYGGQPSEVSRELKMSLLAEQGYLCCYCMRRISNNEKLKVEHWCSQSGYPQFQLEYGNLLAACDGNKGKRRNVQTCDTRKENEDLRYNPANISHDVESRIVYQSDGKIVVPADQLFDAQINNVLNLNEPTLVNNRKAAIQAAKRSLGLKPGSRKKREVEKLLLDLQTPDKNGHLEEYAGAAVFYLKSKLKSTPL